MTDAGIHWFPGLGFRPAVWSSHRADHVDPPRLVPAPDADVAYLCGKPGCLDALRITYNGGADFAAAVAADFSTVAPVPLPASAGLLIAAVVGLAMMRRRG